MRATTELHDDTSIIRLTPGKPLRPQKTSTERVNRLRARRLARGLCREGCGRKLRHHAQRCETCQRRETVRQRKYGSKWHTIRQPTPAERQQDRRRERDARRLAAFLARLDGRRDVDAYLEAGRALTA